MRHRDAARGLDHRTGDEGAWPETASTTGGPLAQTRQRQRTRSRDDDAPIIPILARKVREVEQKAQKGKLGPDEPHEVPGHRAAHARGAGQGQGRRRGRRRGPGRAAQAPRRHRADPREDRGARHEPDRPARTRCVDLDRRPAVPPRLAARIGCRALARRADHHPRIDSRGARALREPGDPRLGAFASAGQPVPRPRLLEAARRRRPRSEARELGAARSALQVVRGRLGRAGGEHGAARGAEGRPALTRADSSS